MRVLRWLGLAFLALIVVALGVGVMARLSDGPMAILAGGPLVAGELVTEPVPDWSFATDVEEIEFQLEEPARSRTVWIVVHEGQLYVPCGFLDVPLWKQWPYEALEDGRSVLRIEGKRYLAQAVRVEELALRETLGRLAAAKYGFGGSEAPPDPEAVWFFRMDPRPAS